MLKVIIRLGQLTEDIELLSTSRSSYIVSNCTRTHTYKCVWLCSTVELWEYEENEATG